MFRRALSLRRQDLPTPLRARPQDRGVDYTRGRQTKNREAARISGKTISPRFQPFPEPCDDFAPSATPPLLKNEFRSGCRSFSPDVHVKSGLTKVSIIRLPAGIDRPWLQCASRAVLQHDAKSVHINHWTSDSSQLQPHCRDDK
jgi:hypothetical protein